jgi:DNA invertase Pin-like site-specific DNA recombinase
MSLIGYARVSTETQNGNGQVTELKKICDEVHLEYASGGRWDRPCLQNVLRHLKAGDVLVVWKLDRLTRSLSDLLQILKRLEGIGAGFRSLTEAIDTTTPVGRMLTQILGSFAEFERQMIRERTKLGLVRARLEGRVGGNRASLTPKQQAHVLAMIDEGRSQTEVAELFKVHRSTICRLVSERRVLQNRCQQIV